MSAWVVSKAHIHYLVKAMEKYGVITEDVDKTGVGKVLLGECRKSVGYRYDEPEDSTGLPGYGEDATYEYEEPHFNDMRPGVAIYEAGCYRYQSCEHHTYDESEAARLIDALVEAANAKLPEEYRGDNYHGADGVEDAPWGIDPKVEPLTCPNCDRPLSDGMWMNKVAVVGRRVWYDDDEESPHLGDIMSIEPEGTSTIVHNCGVALRDELYEQVASMIDDNEWPDEMTIF